MLTTEQGALLTREMHEHFLKDLTQSFQEQPHDWRHFSVRCTQLSLFNFRKWGEINASYRPLLLPGLKNTRVVFADPPPGA